MIIIDEQMESICYFSPLQINIDDKGMVSLHVVTKYQGRVQTPPLLAWPLKLEGESTRGHSQKGKPIFANQ